jgi:putative protein-disulfide isomerase
MEKPQLMYVYDPLCGWCYGFSPVVEQLKNKYAGKVTWQIYSGGLAIGERAVPVKEKFRYIKGALQTVEQTTGVTFGEGFRQLLEEGQYIYNSEPPCIALTVVKSLQGKDPLAFAHDLHHVFFYEGKSLNDLETYLPLVGKQGIDKDTFRAHFQSDTAKRQTYEEFKFVQDIGISGYPALVFVKGEQGYLLARGYQKYDLLDKAIDQLLKEEQVLE